MKRIVNLILTLLVCGTASAQTITAGYVSEDDRLNSIAYSGYTSVCSLMDGDIAQKYAGNQVVGLRIALGSTAVTGVRAYLSTDPSDATCDLASVALTQVKSGWNQVMFTTPYTLTGKEEELYVGYDLTCSFTDERPVLLGTSTHTYGFLVYDNGDYGWGWYDASETGDLAVQLIIAGDHLPDYDIAITELTTDARYYAKSDQMLHLWATLENNGTKAIPGVTLSLYFDGDPSKGGDLVIGEEVSGTMTLPYDLDIAGFNFTPGKHTLTLKVKELADGAQVSAGTAGDDIMSTTLYIYEQSYEREYSLLEVFTSADDDFYGSRFVEPLEEYLSQASNVVPVMIHGSYGEGISDPLAVSNAARLATAAGLQAAPSFALNRCVTPGSTSYLFPYYGPLQAAEFDAMVTYFHSSTPALATVALDCSYNAQTRLLTVNVEGARNEDFKNIFGNGALTIYLTEDKVNGHNHVLRAVMTAALGNEITWNENNGQGFTLTRRYTLEREWVPANVSVVAFISMPTADSTPRDEMEVTNATVFPLASIESVGVQDITRPTSDAASYDLTGRRIDNSPLGPKGRFLKRSSVTLRDAERTVQELKRGIYIIGGRKVVINN